MKKEKIELTELLSYEPSREEILMILEEVRTTGKCIQEVADQYAMPPIFMKDADGLIEYKGEKITPTEFRKRFPYRRIVTIAKRKY